jgi:hypothetical protein
MNRRFWASLLAVALIMLGRTEARTDTHWVDILFLRDGTSVEGLIVDQSLGESIKLSTYEATLLTFEQNEIERVEKRETTKPVPMTFADAIVLLDGVIFRGIIVEQTPGELLVLKTTNGLFLTFPFPDVWKIVKQRLIAASAATSDAAPDPVEAARLELKIVLRQNNLRNRLGEKAQSVGEAETLLEEIEALKDEIDQLQQDNDRLAQEQSDQGLSAERATLEELRAEIERLLDELEATLEQCGQAGESTAAATPLSRLPLRPYKFQILTGFGNDAGSEAQVALQAGEAADQHALLEALDGALKATRKKLPTPEEVAAALEVHKARTQLEALLKSDEWRLPSKENLVQEIVGQLSPDERLFLYQVYRSRELLPSMFLNAALYPSFLGSWKQGDKRGAFIGYLHSLAAGLGAAYLILGIPGNYRWEVVGRPSAMQYLAVPQGDGWYGIALVAGSYLASVLQPVLFEHKQNRRLARALRIQSKGISSRKLKVSIRPPALLLQPTETGDIRLSANLVSFDY